jgi:hypothetical protein
LSSAGDEGGRDGSRMAEIRDGLSQSVRVDFRRQFAVSLAETWYGNVLTQLLKDIAPSKHYNWIN